VFSILLLSLFFLQGCLSPRFFTPQIPEKICPPKELPEPFIYGKGKDLYIFATAGSNVLDVYRTKGPLLEYLGNKLGVRFKVTFYRQYEDIVKAMISGDCDFAWLGPVTYLNARMGVACIPLAQVMINGTGFYKSVILIRKGDRYSDITDLKGKSFAFTDKNSTSGYIYPWNFMKERGIVPEDFFSNTDYTGSHSNAIVQLISGKYAAVAVEENALKRLSEKIDVSSVTILAEAGNIPNGPIAAHPKVPGPLADKMKTLLIDLTTSKDGQEFMNKLSDSVDFSGFAKVSNKIYDNVKEKIEAIE
jgi:phosphate/phosphite/phosphonate ABC transporter binding protein